jgi:CheY-like chemotaxis protein
MKQLLVVEDDDDSRDLVEALLEGLYRCESYADGIAAWERLCDRQRSIPDGMLLDISLPAMDGIELLRRIRADARLASVPAVALTAHAMKHDQERFLAAGFDAYVSKPIVDEELLLETLAGLLAEDGEE